MILCTLRAHALSLRKSVELAMLYFMSPMGTGNSGK